MPEYIETESTCLECGTAVTGQLACMAIVGDPNPAFHVVIFQCPIDSAHQWWFNYPELQATEDVDPDWRPDTPLNPLDTEEADRIAEATREAIQRGLDPK